jgi:putative flavoprotein involved in K+ transport
MKFDYDVVIVGAGASGVGMAHVLKTLGIERVVMLERYEVGASFLRWPKEMRFISPSFTGNAFGLLDLNAVTLETSPAYTLETEHPSGRQFADYLRLIVKEYKLPVKCGVDVLGIQPRVQPVTSSVNGKSGAEPQGFTIQTSDGAVSTRFVVWAAGEFQYPRKSVFPGADLCIHNATIRSWRTLAMESMEVTPDRGGSNEAAAEPYVSDFVVIGGNESGIDSAVNLVRFGKTVTVLDRGLPWQPAGSDPSKTLTPYTLQRLERALKTGRLELVGKTRVKSVLSDKLIFSVSSRSKTWVSKNRPILATGFSGSLQLIDSLFAWKKNGYVELNDRDESTISRGLFVIGPMVRHEAMIFCFIYKFRQRFAVVANAIAEGLEVSIEALEKYRDKQMFLDDLSCCEEECAC